MPLRQAKLEGPAVAPAALDGAGSRSNQEGRVKRLED